MSPTLTRSRPSHRVVFDVADQWRVPRGNEHGGQWVDMPHTILRGLLDKVDVDPPIKTTARSVDMRPATAQDIAEFKTRFGRSLPPSWTNVQVDFGEGADLVAKGTDKAGRTQYVYTAQFHAQQAAEKFERLKQVFQAVPKLDQGLASINGDPTRAATRLMYIEGIRVGSPNDTRAKTPAYGATTLLAKHASVNKDGSVTLAFTAKEGIPVTYEIDDPELVGFITDRLKRTAPDDRLFETNADKTMALLREISGLPGMKNHDLRTLLANRIASAEVGNLVPPPPSTKKQVTEWRKKVAAIVAEQLRNKPEQALSAYINPAIFSQFSGDH